MHRALPRRIGQRHVAERFADAPVAVVEQRVARQRIASVGYHERSVV